MTTTTKTPSKMMRQVKLVREDRPAEDVYWIDNELAKVGKRVVDGAGVIWRVAEIYNARPFADVEQQIETWAEFAKTLEDTEMDHDRFRARARDLRETA